MLGKNSKKVRKNLCLNKKLISKLEENMDKQEVKTSLSNIIEAIIFNCDQSNLNLIYLRYKEYLEKEKKE